MLCRLLPLLLTLLLAASIPAHAEQPSGQESAAPATTPVQRYDYAVNAQSEVFGNQLFTGAFVRQGGSQFNPDYAITLGDAIQVRLWGGFSYDGVLTVDARGNIFLPEVGPVKVLGVSNKDLEQTVRRAVRRVFRANVHSYASLASAQPVRVFVSGYVRRPGLYNGTSMDSLLHYLDQAGGIDPQRGSFLDVQVKRGEMMRARVSLYDFLLDGQIPLIQLADGDVIFVAARKNTVMVSGLVENARRFEFAAPSTSLSELANLAKAKPEATHVRVVRNRGAVRNVEYFALVEADNVIVNDGDEVVFTADKKPGTITVRVEGEHESPQEYVLPYGTRLGVLLERIEFSERSDTESLQLFRVSVRERQRELLHASLRSLESAALTARSGTNDEASLRREEAELILQWVERARAIEPAGQVLIGRAESRDMLLLENGDIVRVPNRDGLVLISGEVLFPTAVVHQAGNSVEHYIELAGGYTQNADASRVVVAHRDGSFTDISGEGTAASSDGYFWWDEKGTANATISPGDEILVLPRIDVKSRQIAKDLTQILYHIAVSAKVVLGL